MLEEAVNEALPRFYGEAVESNDLKVLGQPEVDVTEFEDGEHLSFTAEVDVRPEFDLPDYDGLEVTVDDAEVTDADVDEQLDGLRERFAHPHRRRPRRRRRRLRLHRPRRPRSTARPIDDLTAKGLSYEVGAGLAARGPRRRVTGLSAGESEDVRRPTLVGGDHAARRRPSPSR